MDKTTKLLGIDLSKSRFQLHGIKTRNQCVLKALLFPEEDAGVYRKP